MKPKILQFSNNQKDKFDSFINSFRSKDYKIFDLFEKMVKDKYGSENPSVYFSKNRDDLVNEFYKNNYSESFSFSYGMWVVFEWKNEVYHILDQQDLFELRTIRNRGIISLDEQQKIYSKKIALIGLSVGSGLVNSFVRTGLGSSFNIADFDRVDSHNLNRAPFFLRDIGVKKLEVVVDQLYSIDPYLQINEWDAQIDEKNIDKFIESQDLIVDCFDEFKSKLALKQAARKRRIPILSGFNISNGAMVIVERYDLDRELSMEFFLNGYSENEVFKTISSPKDKTDLFVNIIGRQNHDKKMLEAVYTVGSKLSGYPQVMVGTSAIAAIWTIAAIDTLLGYHKNSIRKYFDLEKMIFE